MDSKQLYSNETSKREIVGSGLWFSVVMTAVAAGFALFGYEIVRSASNTLIKAHYGTIGMSWSLAIVPLCLVVLLSIYNLSLTRFGVVLTSMFSFVFSAAIMVLCFGLLSRGISFGALVMFVLREAYIVIIIEQCWSFLNSIMKVEEGKRWNGLIIGLSTFGAIGGGASLTWIAPAWGTTAMLLVGATTLFPAACCMWIAYSSAPMQQRFLKQNQHNLSQTWRLGVGELLQSRLLKLIFFMVVLNQVLYAGLNIYFQNLLQINFPNAEQQTAVSGQFYAAVNTVACIFQFAVTPLLLKYVALFKVHAGVAAINLIFLIAAFFKPDPYVVGAAYICFKALDYSVFRAAKELLYIPLSFDVRFRSKEFIDVFGYRSSKGLGSGIIAILQPLSQSVGIYLSLLAACAWLLGVLLARRQINEVTDQI